MHRYVLAGCVVAWMASPLVRAQGPPPPPIAILGAEPLEFGEVITGAPFMAEATSEQTQEFVDGNRIERKSTSLVARDGSGRVRREHALPQIGPVAVGPEMRLVTITDPLRKMVYTIDAAQRTLFRFPMPDAPPGGGPPRHGERGGRPPLPPPRMASENLGTREIAGVRAEGTRHTMTIPAGAFGNVRPIDVVTERWFSPELKIVVESRRTDPRTGEVVYRVVSLTRGEPSRELFEVPSDYTVVERPRPPGPGPRKPEWEREP